METKGPYQPWCRVLFLSLTRTSWDSIWIEEVLPYFCFTFQPALKSVVFHGERGPVRGSQHIITIYPWSFLLVLLGPCASLLLLVHACMISVSTLPTLTPLHNMIDSYWLNALRFKWRLNGAIIITSYDHAWSITSSMECFWPAIHKTVICQRQLKWEHNSVQHTHSW